MSARECPGCGKTLPLAADANAAAIGEHVARRLNCATINDVPDVLKRVLASNADVATYMRQRDEAECAAQIDRERAAALRVENTRLRTRADAAEAEVARLRAAMGRTVPPTDAEWAAIIEHDCTLIVTAEPSMATTVATRGELDALCDAADEAGEAYVWIVVGADGWPRPWPTGGDAGR